MNQTFRKFSAALANQKHLKNYPRNFQDLDSLPKVFEDFVGALGVKYPGHDDPEYMSWLTKTRTAPSRIGAINPVHYTKDNLSTWKQIYSRLRNLQYQYACAEHIQNLKALEDQSIITSHELPNFSKLNKFLGRKTGFQLVNVGGMIEPRVFLNGLAYKVFYSTQYIRHKSVPFYSPEPDIVHEVMGHVPMLANPLFARFSQAIGEMSLGASDQGIDVLSKIYFYTVEFGVVTGKVVGAGVLGSCEELKFVGEAHGKVEKWDLKAVLKQRFTLSEYQPRYFEIASLKQLYSILEQVEAVLE